jgi:hypothetical protein
MECLGAFIKRTFLSNNKIFFSENIKYGEDLYFQYVSYVFLEQIFILNDSVYHYTVRNNSLTLEFAYSDRRVFQFLNLFQDVFAFYSRRDLFNKYDIAMFSDTLFPPYTYPQKDEYFLQLKDYFVNIKEHVSDRWYLYNNSELMAFYGILGDFSGYIQNNTHNKSHEGMENDT